VKSPVISLVPSGLVGILFLSTGCQSIPRKYRSKSNVLGAGRKAHCETDDESQKRDEGDTHYDEQYTAIYMSIEICSLWW